MGGRRGMGDKAGVGGRGGGGAEIHVLLAQG